MRWYHVALLAGGTAIAGIVYLMTRPKVPSFKELLTNYQAYVGKDFTLRGTLDGPMDQRYPDVHQIIKAEWALVQSVADAETAFISLDLFPHRIIPQPFAYKIVEVTGKVRAEIGVVSIIQNILTKEVTVSAPIYLEVETIRIV